VVIDRSLQISDVNVVVLDNVDSAYRLTAHLVEHGSQWIAALCGEMRTPGPERRAWDEKEKALRAHGLALLAEQVKYVQPPLTLIAQPADEIGKTATALLRQRVADPDRPPRQVILKGQLLVRGSSTPRR
jgi:DNA-binding LacI/PurR family transcriptional regulator